MIVEWVPCVLRRRRAVSLSFACYATLPAIVCQSFDRLTQYRMIRILRYQVLARLFAPRVVVGDTFAARRRLLNDVPYAQELKIFIGPINRENYRLRNRGDYILAQLDAIQLEVDMYVQIIADARNEMFYKMCASSSFLLLIKTKPRGVASIRDNYKLIRLTLLIWKPCMGSTMGQAPM